MCVFWFVIRWLGKKPLISTWRQDASGVKIHHFYVLSVWFWLTGEETHEENNKMS